MNAKKWQAPSLEKREGRGYQKLLSLRLLVQSRAWANQQVGHISPNMNLVQS